MTRKNLTVSWVDDAGERHWKTPESRPWLVAGLLTVALGALSFVVCDTKCAIYSTIVLGFATGMVVELVAP